MTKPYARGVLLRSSAVRILAIETTPIHEIDYAYAGPKGRSAWRRLPILDGDVDALPTGLVALVVASDLQGVASSLLGGEAALLGIRLASDLLALAEEGALPSPERTGVVLAGDLFSAPEADLRGASGDVRTVWEAFAEGFRWVAGVLGNHDTLGTEKEAARLRARDGVAILDGDSVALDGLIAGVGRIAGNEARKGRRDPAGQDAHIERALAAQPDVLVLHEGPDLGRDQPGRDSLGALVDGRVPLLVCGHSHWRDPLGALARGTQVLNVDARCVVLRPR